MRWLRRRRRRKNAYEVVPFSAATLHPKWRDFYEGVRHGEQAPEAADRMRSEAPTREGRGGP